MSDSYTTLYNPDVLSTLANLSSDEVFTPPHIVNQMLDMLPFELFKNKHTTFLDPATKSGVFLREIAKRLLVGLQDEIPNLQERIDNIFQKQLYGLATTEMTSLLSRRSVYCSKYPNSRYSISVFNNPEGNIRFKQNNHKWQNDRCIFCGASKKELDRDSALENYAYELLHNTTPEEIFNMKFDVIIGNPPYQLNVGNDGGNSSKARAIYNLFISQSIKLKPRFLCMITPSRWMTRSVEGISDSWINEMLNDHRIRIMHDFLDANDIFSGTPPEGGVNFFLWERDYNGKCNYLLYKNAADKEPTIINDYLNSQGLGIVLRDEKALDILKKIEKIEGKYEVNQELNFSGLVSPKDFYTNKVNLTSSWKGFSEVKTKDKNIKYFLNKAIHKKAYAYISMDDIPKSKEDIPKNLDSIKLHKVLIPAAHGGKSTILGKPFYSEPNSVCSQTYLVIGFDPEKHNFSYEQCQNIISYIQTKFFRYLVSIKKKTQNGARHVYQFVPKQNFDLTWTDKKLFEKYSLSNDEISFIENSIKLTDDKEGEVLDE